MRVSMSLSAATRQSFPWAQQQGTSAWPLTPLWSGTPMLTRWRRKLCRRLEHCGGPADVWTSVVASSMWGQSSCLTSYMDLTASLPPSRFRSLIAFRSCRTERRERYTVCRLTPRLSLCSNGCPCTEFGSATPRSGSSWCGAVSMGKPAVSSRTYSHHQLAATPGTRFPGASLSLRHSQKPADLAWPFRQPWPGTLSQGV